MPRSRNAPAMSSACGPLSLTTPNAPRPCGVAMATMVSSVANNLLLRGDDDRLHERVADALRRHVRILGDREMHDAPLVRVERPHLLRHAARARLLRDELRHLPQLRVLLLAIAVAVDDDAIVVAELLAERRRDDVLQRLQAFAAAAHEHTAVLAIEVDARPFGSLLDVHRHRHPHRVDDVLHEPDDL